MSNQATTTARRRFWGRFLLAGPWTFLAAFVVMASLATWLPEGPGQVDNLILPLVLFPLIWAVMFFHACLTRDLKRATVTNLAVTGLCGVLLAVHFVST